ncbi:peptidase S8/S53 domain-containing protein [Cercophora newfieldiana]|uniref:Peptidase S8/S53 domain-containing protein n=1 Tax=Cercophora newfieldiana TaxID=92897 RepID=A0AA40CIE3_9PEZI|nr:peptidase S8/S53 domain-containing protein [Cercophora newfieldiana]
MGLVKLATAFLAAAALGRAVDLDAATAVPGAYIVEYEDDGDTHSFVGGLDGATLRSDLRSKVFNGASIEFADHKKAEKVMTKMKFARGNRIKNVWPVKKYSLPDDIVHATGPLAGPHGFAPESSFLKRQAAADQDEFTPHVMTQVDKLRKAGFTGKGIKVAIVDTGIDWGHPALGGCFGPGCLVSFGEDLVGDNYTGSNIPNGDPDPMDQCNGHGTHVAGIIAAQANNTYGILGGSPDVTLGAYRVFGCQGQVGNDVLIKAYLQAYKAGADIITASIGGAAGWMEEPWAVVVSRIVEEGVVCVLSAGNDGSVGQFYASTASNGRLATSIGSFDNIVTPSIVTTSTFSVANTTAAGTYNFTASSNTPTWSSVNYPLWAVNFDTTDPSNGCAPYPANTPNLTNTIVLVRRGNCTFVEKVQYAVAKGARHVLVYNNIPGPNISPSADVRGALAVAMVPAAQGEEWIKALQAGEKVFVNLPNPETASKSTTNFPNEASGGFLSNYTSWGPTFEMNLKPQFSAPGGSILSTYPRELGSYAVLSGTSMSCPLAASIYALLMNVRGTKDPKTLENLLAATSNPQLWRVGSSAAGKNWLAPAPQQGAGLMQAWDAAYATTHLGVSSLSFNDTDNFIPEKDFTVDNKGAKAVTYTIGHRPAAASYTFPGGNSTTASALPMELAGEFATLAFSPSTFTLPAGAREIVTVKVTPPTGLDAKRLPIYSGFVTVSGSDGSNFSFPYIGAAGSLHDTPVLIDGNAWVARSDDTNRPGRPVPLNTTFTLPPPGHVNDTLYKGRSVLPRIWVTMSFGSILIRGDVVPLSNCSTAALNATTVLGLKTVGQLEDFPSYHNRRGTLGAVDWSGLMADGSYIQPGRYKIVFRALRVNGDPTLASEYDVAESQEFRIQYVSVPMKKKREVKNGEKAVKRGRKKEVEGK